MQNSDASGDKEIQDLQQLWQQTITTNSLKIKEREMVQDIQQQMGTFEKKFGFGASRGVQSIVIVIITIILNYFLQTFLFGWKNSGLISLFAASIFALLFGYQVITKRQMRHFDMRNLYDYFTFSLMRVRRQMLVQILYVPFVIIALFVIWFTSDKGKAVSTLGAIIISSIIIAGLSTFLAWEYKHKLIPLRDKLQSALQQLNEH